MLVQVFLASAERRGGEEVGQGVRTLQNQGEKAAVCLSHTTKPTPLPTPHSPCMKSDNVVGGKQQGLSSGFSTRK